MSQGDEYRRAKRNDLAHVVTGAGMIGSGTAARVYANERFKGKGLSGDIREIRAGGVKGRHVANYATKLGTRGVVTAGIPLGVTGAVGLLNERSRTKPVDFKHDVVDAAVDRTTVVPVTVPKSGRERNKSRLVDLAAATGAGALGGMAGGKVAGRYIKNRNAARIIGGTAGTIGGAALAYPAARKLVPAATGGRYDYEPHGSVDVRGVRKAMYATMPPVTTPTPTGMPNQEHERLMRRKRVQRNIGLTSAGLGLTAIGLRIPQMAGHLTKIKRLSGSKPLNAARKTGEHLIPVSDSVGLASLGVGSAGAINSARIQGSEYKEDKQASRLAKALILKHPKRFGGVRSGGLRRVRTTLGVKTISYRGSLG